MHYLFDRYLTVKNVALLALDVVVIAAVTACAIWLRTPDTLWYILSPAGYLLPILVTVAVYITVLYYQELYSLRGLRQFRYLAVTVIQAVALASLVLVVLYAVFPEMPGRREVFLVNLIALPPFLTLGRAFYIWLSRGEALCQRVAVLGDADRMLDMCERLKGNDNYRVVGAILMDTDECPQGVSCLGAMDDLRELVIDNRIDRVVVSMKERRGRLPLQDLLYLKTAGVSVMAEADFLERVTGRVPVAGLSPSSLVFSDGFKRIQFYERARRIPDTLAALLLAAMLSPFLLLVAALIRLDSSGPALYRQERVGRAGKPFLIYKFRTMRPDAEKEGAQFADENDPRMTRLGRVLRKFRIDELPQLINVVKGEMSFVGPRPERPEFVAELQEKIPYYYLRTIIRPGITGWAQVRYPYGATVKQHREKLEHDLYYIKNMSLTLDSLIAFETVRVALGRRGGR